jgi:hypothetical protein
MPFDGDTMLDATSRSSTAPARPELHTDYPLQARIRAEYREMPGMRLTLVQAARLFNLAPAHCRRVLEALVADGTLWTNGREFLGAGAGRRCA